MQHLREQQTGVACTVSSELLGFWFWFFHYFAFLGRALDSWPSRQLLSARKSTVSYRIISLLACGSARQKYDVGLYLEKQKVFKTQDITAQKKKSSFWWRWAIEKEKDCEKAEHGHKLTSHTRTVVRECCKDDDQSQWERPKLDPPPHLKPLIDRHQNLPTWLRRGYLPSCKSSSTSDKGFCFCACAISRIKLFTRLFVRFLGGFFISSTAKTPARILTQNTSKDAVPRKDVPFGGRKTKS